MRRNGTRLPAHHVADPIQGEVVAFDRYDEPDRFYVRLFHPGQFTDWSHELHSARLERTGRGVHLFRGETWDPGVKEHRLQTWLCTATRERGHEILANMGVRELAKARRP